MAAVWSSGDRSLQGLLDEHLAGNLSLAGLHTCRVLLTGLGFVVHTLPTTSLSQILISCIQADNYSLLAIA